MAFVAPIVLLFALVLAAKFGALGPKPLSVEELAVGDLESLGSSVQQWHEAVGTWECPPMTELQRWGYASRKQLTDRWGHRHRILCEGHAVLTFSAGPDQVFDTPDDIVVRLFPSGHPAYRGGEVIQGPPPRTRHRI